MRGVVAGDGGGRDEEHNDQQPEPGPRREGERELADAEGRAASDEADDDAAERAGAGVKGPHADCQTDEKWERKSSERKQQPAEKSDGGEDE